MVRNILITGASSGIGAALAEAYAEDGVFLALTGRDEARLHTVVTQCQTRGAQVQSAQIDVTDAPALAEWIAEVDQTHPLDLVIANAGISAGSGRAGIESAEQMRQVFDVNLHGVLNTILPAIEKMQPRGSGQIALMGSLAGFRGLPGAASYAASKAAIRSLGESLRLDLTPYGIRINTLCPGFVETHLTAKNRFPMPFLMSADQAARIIKRGLERNKARIAFPWPTFWAARMLGLLPLPLSDFLLKRAPRKGG